MTRWLAFLAVALVGSAALAEARSLDHLTLCIRVTTTEPKRDAIYAAWRRGGEGLGGEVFRGQFQSAKGETKLPLNEWSAPFSLKTIVGDGRSWIFPTIVIADNSSRKNSQGLSKVSIDFEFLDDGKVFKSFTESAPTGASASFAFPGNAPDDVEGLSTYAHARLTRLQKQFPDPPMSLKQFAIIGHLGGYGEGGGRGIRHCNPEILVDECRVLQVLGMNSLIGEGSVNLADAGGAGADLRKMYWGRIGGGGKNLPESVCPFTPDPRANKRGDQIELMMGEFKRVGAQQFWAQQGDEIGVVTREHVVTCPKCAEEFEKYLESQHVTLKNPTPYPIFKPGIVNEKGKKKDGGLVDPPADPDDALRFYYTFRFLTFVTAPEYRANTEKFKTHGIPMFTMLQPSPSWNGSPLDWHEFEDNAATSAFVWETSNTDPQVWQMESYLADIARGICERHNMPMGCLVKPHRGAPQQRMMSAVTRGARAFEWYTYGPDYAKGDSFSQSPELLRDVATADRFLARCEDYLFGAKRVGNAQVALVLPRSSEIWGRATPLGVTAMEDAKWTYIALAHVHVPLDILSEQRLAEGKLEQYKAIYIVGPNLRRDAGENVLQWVRAGGTLWTDAGGLARDEANQPAPLSKALFGDSERKMQIWGTTPPYRAIDIKQFEETNAPADVAQLTIHPVVGREVFNEPVVLRQQIVKGEVILVPIFAGLTYSAQVRRPDFDMRIDFDSRVRALIADDAILRKIDRSVVPSDPLIEAVYLEKDKQRCVALMNWGYHGRQLEPIENLKITLPPDVKSVRSITHGPLVVENHSANLPSISEVDLLVLQ